MTGTPLPAWLATLGQAALAEVLAARADVCGPAEPDGWDDLAERLQQRRSVERALRRLTRPCVQAAEAAATLGQDATRVRITAQLDWPGSALDKALTTLERHALVWPGHGEVMHVAEALCERWPARAGAAWQAPFDPLPPGLPTVPIGAERVERTAAARLGEFVGHAAGMLAECGRRPLQVFRVAGMQPRALQRVMRAARCGEPSARLAVACAQRAGLLANDGRHLGLSPGGDAFTSLPPGEQAARLLLAWWNLPSAPTRTRSDDGKQLYPLSAKADCDGCVQVRHELVTVLQRVPEGQGAQAPEDLGRVLDWHRPLACDHASGRPPHSALLQEAVLLGLVAHGVLSSFGALLAAGDHDGLAREASRVVPAFSERTTIAPDPMATVRGTPSSLQEVPATCVFHCADTGLLARAVRHPALQGLGVRLLSPGVLIATGPRESVLMALGAAGYPAAEDPAPGPLPPPASGEPPPDFEALAERLRQDPYVPPRSAARTRPAAPRPRRPPRPSGSRPPRPSGRRSELERALGVVTREARELRSDEIRLLARAVAEDERVRITYVDQNGVETVRVIGPPYEMVRRNKKKLLKAICELRSAETGRQEERNFHYSRILAVEAVDGP
ncbi:WYL domain-containing protein [Actinomadura sp. 7K507]|uniref:WYL domain-containing protein n=1 Tax=Actinomadura sp. 7K507 TaxID=2530365 RepID=UPI001051BD2C|nr:WYL domain-containing protein [Actinomadura sp. 7K507]TDC86464.1 hypothetical protein E1285_23170 [Actinomadura sp. 7K507]